jgi:bifunctional non-homologous end joining protein LigD
MLRRLPVTAGRAHVGDHASVGAASGQVGVRPAADGRAVVPGAARGTPSRVATAETTIRAGRRKVRISNPGKVLFPEDGLTKADLASYYAAVAPAMLPHTRDRPMNLWRWNTGIHDPVVVQQAIPKGAPEWVRRVEVARRRGGSVDHVVGGEAATLVWLANQNCITPHVWTSRADRPDHPDRLVFDFDPPDDDDGHFPAIRAGALVCGEILRDHGLVPWVMTSGSRGLHVVAPIRRRGDSDHVRAVAGELAEEVAARRPDELTTAWRKAGRSGRVLVDAARNTYAQTAVAPYAVRAKPGAPVATPLSWDELEDPALHPRRWTLATVPERLAERGDPWERIAAAAAPMPS